MKTDVGIDQKPDESEEGLSNVSCHFHLNNPSAMRNSSAGVMVVRYYCCKFPTVWAVGSHTIDESVLYGE